MSNLKNGDLLSSPCSFAHKIHLNWTVSSFFWEPLRNISEWMAVKTAVIVAIDIALKENGIRIPFPQQDIHILSVPKEDPNGKNEIENDQ